MKIEVFYQMQMVTNIIIDFAWKTTIALLTTYIVITTSDWTLGP